MMICRRDERALAQMLYNHDISYVCIYAISSARDDREISKRFKYAIAWLRRILLAEGGIKTI